MLESFCCINELHSSNIFIAFYMIQLEKTFSQEISFNKVIENLAKLSAIVFKHLWILRNSTWFNMHECFQMSSHITSIYHEVTTRFRSISTTHLEAHHSLPIFTDSTFKSFPNSICFNSPDFPTYWIGDPWACNNFPRLSKATIPILHRSGVAPKG